MSNNNDLLSYLPTYLYPIHTVRRCELGISNSLINSYLFIKKV